MENNGPFTVHTAEPAKKSAVATFSMGCFWHPDALFGATDGVAGTLAGYAGGTTPAPSYRTMGDHIETIQLLYDPSVIKYPELLSVFFANHKPLGKPWKRQYSSAIFFHSAEQKEQALEAKERSSTFFGQEVYTPVIPYEHFYRAEDRHQKYKLQRHPLLLNWIQERFGNFQEMVDSTAAARLNGYLYGFGTEEAIVQFTDKYRLSAPATEVLLSTTRLQPKIYCKS